MEFIPFDDFPEIQQKIINFKLQNPKLVWREWMTQIEDELSIHFTPLTLGRFIKKTALGFQWNENSSGGRNPFLCPTDLNNLKDQCIERCHLGTNYIEFEEFLELALELKVSRLLYASKFLQSINCQKFSTHLNAEEELEPSRQWINNTVSKLGLSLEFPSSMAEERFDASSKTLIKQFYTMYQQRIEACPRSLLFGADETMLKAVMKQKVICETKHDALLRRESDIPHITAMCCNNVIGNGPPPMIILPNSLQKLPAELKQFELEDAAWFCSSKSGWMNRDLFLVWSVHFLNWLSLYRVSLPSNIRACRALLVVDGHGSRECPLALQILAQQGVDVLVLPAHTTHITQMFDVVLAAPLKKAFTKYMRKLIKENPLNGEEHTQIARLRYYSIISFLSAWQNVRTLKMCTKAAATTGWYPFDADAAASSRYAETRTEEQDQAYLDKRAQRSRLDINAKMITAPDVLQEITEAFSNHPHFSHLTTSPVPPGSSWKTFCLAVCKPQLNNSCYHLSHIPSFVNSNGNVECFN